jgi:hypothetical protein
LWAFCGTPQPNPLVFSKAAYSMKSLCFHEMVVGEEVVIIQITVLTGAGG